MTVCLKGKSPHILSTSTNLLGFCLIVLTSIKISNYGEKSLIDEFTGVAAILLSLSSFFSFLSIRSAQAQKGEQLENIAEWLFLTGLTILVIIIILVSLNTFL